MKTCIGTSFGRAFSMAAIMAGALVLSGCATAYVDGNQPDIPKAQYRKPEQPKATQLVFEFRTNGQANPRATEALKSRVASQISESGLFASVSDTPVAGNALLTVTINNVPLTDNAAAKGFMTGLTFGLAGSVVGDGYEGNLRYVAAAGATPVTPPTAKHALWTKIGSGAAPAGAIEAPSIGEGVNIMLRQLLSRMLDDLSKAPGFVQSSAVGAVATSGAR